MGANGSKTPEAILFNAAKKGDLKTIKQIIYPGWIFPRLVLSRFYNKSNFDIRQNIVEFVGVYGIDLDITIGDVNTYSTALHVASQEGKTDCVEMLLKSGANINSTNNGGVTALHCASVWGRSDCIEILLKNGANINATDISGWTALQMASSGGKPDCVEILLKFGADSTLDSRATLNAWRICRGLEP